MPLRLFGGLGHNRWMCFLFAIVASVSVWRSVAAEGKPATPNENGSASVLQLLETHCVQCHGGEKTKARLDLTTREALLRGGESGPAVVSGQPESSLLYRQVTHAEEPGMPYRKEKLSPESINRIRQWIGAGVPYDRPLQKTPATAQSGSSQDFVITDRDRAHWAFQPLRRVAQPVTKNPAWPKTPVDRFILAALETKGISPAPPASKEQFIRRVTFDLIGLPPTLEEIDAFVVDDSIDAGEKLIDRLLASPHYGERWGRHWLDLARFAESDGFEHDAVRPNAWRYRDYVVQSFNADKPYDRFIREQLAGDELYPGDAEALVATAFNLLGPDMVDSADQVQRRHNTLNDMTDTTGLVFLGLTLGCARCHDHKFEPLAQRDYYTLQAFFTPVAFRHDLPIPRPAEKSAYDAALQEFNGRTQAQQKEIGDIEAPYRQKLYQEKLAKLSEEARLAHQTPSSQRTAEQINQIQETAELVKVSEPEILKAMNEADKTRHRALKDLLKKIPKPAPLPMTMGLQNSNGPPAKTFILGRGEYGNQGDEVGPGFPLILATAQRSSARPPASSERNATRPTQPGSAGAATGRVSRRADLANWIADPENPLTARVMVNRIWQHHFGRGIVSTPSDFGVRGQPPSHPELLDWLAAEFMTRGWSIKQMHKLILMSATYRQSSQAASETWARDPDNRLYSRWNRLRLEGEILRDSLLAISGRLNRGQGGPGVFPPIPEDVFKGATGWKASPEAQEHVRRSIYIFARRNLRFPFLEVFDAPDNNLSCSARERSTSAPQSLTLLNDDEVVRTAKTLAERVTREASRAEERIALMYRLILGRRPTAQELAYSREFLERSPLSELGRALFNLNAFVYVE